MTAYTPRALSTNRLQQVVNQPTHGFSVGDVVIYDFNGFPAAPWFLALANMTSSCFCSMMVSFVLDVNNFVVTQMGYISNITSQTLSQGGNYYLSPTNAPPAQLTVIRPTSVGQVILPCFVANSPTSGFFFGGSGELIEPATAFTWNVETAGPVNMLANNGYIINSASPITLNLPATFAVGDIITVTGINTGGWIIQNGGAQEILIGQQGATSLGGTLASTNGQDSVDLIGVVADITLTANNIEGNLSFT